MKIARWTISKQNSMNNKIALFSLKKSIESFEKLYPEFKKYVCYNNIDYEDIKFLHNKNVEFVDQKKHLQEIDISPHDSFWKYYPPRLSISSYEVFIDNDIIFHKQIPELNLFLNQRKILFTSGYKEFYGQFDSLVKKRIKLNTGFFGLPPFFDFKKEINNTINKNKIKKLKSHFDDQGLFCLILNKNEYIQIPLEVFNVCNSNLDFADYKLGLCATHFAGINRKNFSYFKKFVLSKLL